MLLKSFRRMYNCLNCVLFKLCFFQALNVKVLIFSLNKPFELLSNFDGKRQKT